MKLPFVSREAYDAQTQELGRARERIATLESQRDQMVAEVLHPMVAQGEVRAVSKPRQVRPSAMADKLSDLCRLNPRLAGYYQTRIATLRADALTDEEILGELDKPGFSTEDVS